MVKKYYLFIALGLLLVQMGCTDTSTDKPVSNSDSLLTDTLENTIKKDSVIVRKDLEGLYQLTAQDKVILDLLDKIELGFNFTQIKAVYPLVKGIRPEEKRDDLATEGLTESVCKQPLFEGIATAEFNFKKDSVYSYFFTFNEKKLERSEQIFDALMEYYSGKLGDPSQDNIEEEDHYNQIYNWPAKKNSIYFVNYNMNTGVLIWGKKVEKTTFNL